MKFDLFFLIFCHFVIELAVIIDQLNDSKDNDVNSTDTNRHNDISLSEKEKFKQDPTYPIPSEQQFYYENSVYFSQNNFYSQFIVFQPVIYQYYDNNTNNLSDYYLSQYVPTNPLFININYYFPVFLPNTLEMNLVTDNPLIYQDTTINQESTIYNQNVEYQTHSTEINENDIVKSSSDIINLPSNNLEEENRYSSNNQIRSMKPINQEYPIWRKKIKEFQQSNSYKRMNEEVYQKLHFSWNHYIINEIKSLDAELFEYYTGLYKITDWNKLDKGCRMFKKNLNDHIEFHKPTTFTSVTFFRKKCKNEPSNLFYRYLVVKGDPVKHFKNLSWSGNKIFIMDPSNIGKNVILNGHTFIGPNCKIGDNVFIHHSCFLKKNVEVEKKTFIDRNNYFGNGCKIGIKNEKEKNSFNSSDQKENLKISEIEKDHFRTIVGAHNFFGDNKVIPYGSHTGKKMIYP